MTKENVINQEEIKCKPSICSDWKTGLKVGEVCEIREDFLEDKALREILNNPQNWAKFEFTNPEPKTVHDVLPIEVLKAWKDLDAIFYYYKSQNSSCVKPIPGKEALAATGITPGSPAFCILGIVDQFLKAQKSG